MFRRPNVRAQRCCRGPGRARRLPGILLLGCLVLAGPAAGQSGPVDLAASEARYGEALAAYDAAIAEVQRVFVLQERALEETSAARRSGDGARLDRAFNAAFTRGMELQQREREADRAAGRLREAQRALLADLEAREMEILDQLDAGPAPATRAQLVAEWERIRRRTLEVEPEVGLEEEIALQPVPELTVDPRDGPVELRQKAAIMEEWATEYDSLAVRLQREIGERERRAQQDRGREDLIAGLSRFDPEFNTDLIPGGRLGPRLPPGGSSGDSEGDGATSALAQLSLEEQVEVLRRYHDLALEHRDLALERAELFRNRAEGGSP